MSNKKRRKSYSFPSPPKNKVQTGVATQSATQSKPQHQPHYNRQWQMDDYDEVEGWHGYGYSSQGYKGQPFSSQKTPSYPVHGYSSGYQSSYQPRTPRRNALKLRFNPLAWLKYVFLCHAFNFEVGSFGISKSPAQDDLLYVEELHIIAQTSSSAHTEFDDNALAEFFEIMTIDRKIPLEQCSRLWFHTHPEMSADPSGTDENTFATKFDGTEWAVMGIFSKRNDSYARLKYNKGPGIERELDWEVDWARFPEVALQFASGEGQRTLQAQWRAEVAEKVNANKPFSSYPSYSPPSYGPAGSVGNPHQSTAKPNAPAAPGAGYTWVNGVWVPKASSSFSPAAEKPPSTDSLATRRLYDQLDAAMQSMSSNPEDDTVDAGYQGDDAAVGVDRNAEWKEGLSESLTSRIITGGAMSDATIFERFIQNRDWLVNEITGKYEPRDSVLGQSSLVPVNAFDGVVQELWAEVVGEFAAMHPDIQIPLTVFKERAVWIPEEPVVPVEVNSACQPSEHAVSPPQSGCEMSTPMSPHSPTSLLPFPPSQMSQQGISQTMEQSISPSGISGNETSFPTSD
jgi:hypothetical protein